MKTAIKTRFDKVDSELRSHRKLPLKFWLIMLALAPALCGIIDSVNNLGSNVGNLFKGGLN